MQKPKSKRAPDAKGMRGIRSRVKSSGRLRRKRADTKLVTVEKTYRRSLGKDKLQLQTVLKRRRKKSLKKLLE